jgi:hypothetical protein
MTIAAGFLCRDGMVICTDSELNYDALKLGTSKSFDLVSKGGTILTITGAGHWNYIRMAIQKIGALWLKIGTTDLGPSDCVALVEAAVLEIYEKHIPLFPGEPKPGFSLIVGLRSKDGAVSLITSSETAVIVNHTFEIVGVGETFGKYIADLLNRLSGPDGRKLWFPNDFSVREAAIWAAYIFWISKRYTPGCGGPTRIEALMCSGERFTLWPVEPLEERFEKWGSIVHQLFPIAIDTALPDRQFRDSLKTFSDDLTRLRKEWQLTPLPFTAQQPTSELWEHQRGNATEDDSWTAESDGSKETPQ